MACLDDTTVDDLMGGRLDESGLRTAESHLDGCADCSALVSALAGGTTRPSPGSSIGRHTIVSVLGHGAMGVVYLARDPELDRHVALKLIRPGAATGAADRLVAEAQAMAKLSHPNVATVYEVGRAGADVYFSMEHVAGATLREWIRVEAPSGPAVIDAILQAGAGLSAAHAAGLVHRDLKPENILCGADGRVRVSDFGLAALIGEAASPSEGPPRLVGTPAYMAPEQLDGREATPASDQFALAVCLCEALGGVRPFTGGTPAELRAAIARGPNLSALTKETRSLRRAIGRALAADPEARFPSVTDFTGALRPATGGRLGVAPALALGAVAACAGGLWLATRSDAGPTTDTCDAGGARVAPVWSEGRANAVRSAFEKTDSPLASNAQESVERTLDGYAERWAGAYRATCEATHVHHEQSAAVLDARMRCLDRRLVAFDALVTSFEHASAATVRGAPAAALELPHIDECAHVEAVLGADPRPRDDATAASLDALERDLAALGATNAAGLGASTVADARALVERARALGYRPALAEAALFAARVARRAGALDAARDFANEAQATAEAARADGAAARAWLEVLAVAGQSGRFDDADEHLRRADAAITRAGDPPALRAAWSLQRGLTHTALGRLDAAGPELDRALSLTEAAFGPESIEIARVMTARGDLARQAGKLDDALAIHTRALAIDARALGAEHPAVARHHHNVAGVLRRLGRLDDALASYERALALERLLGEEHPSVGLTENSIGLVLAEQGKAADARARFERSAAILEKASDPDRSHALVNLADLDVADGKPTDAIARLDEAIALLDASAGKAHPRAVAAREKRDLLRQAAPRPRPVSSAGPPLPPGGGSYGGSTSWGE